MSVGCSFAEKMVCVWSVRVLKEMLLFSDAVHPTKSGCQIIVSLSSLSSLDWLDGPVPKQDDLNSGNL